MFASLSRVAPAVAVVAAVPLVLSACGSKEESANAPAPTSTVTSSAKPSSSATTTSSSTTSAKESTTKPSDQPKSPQKGDSANAPAVPVPAPGAAAAGENPFENGDIQVAEIDPIQGQPANPDQVHQITTLVGGLYEQQTLHDFLLYMPRHSCQEVVAEQGGEKAFNLDGVPNMPMNNFPGWNASGIKDVSNVVVNGDVASASITASTAEGTDTKTQRFRNEGGEWKFCR
ncbi:hypothetical protein [Corynebacterium tapiri]|uniref:Secreted protein n=1 Tax=Corynebacterium tapiri TaxID=1448266 RepID=A0A5C4U645_9CORY|nr:hypothetical protein [Corynebacterium tapiri]TNL99362.1 hypothetical protein FHE74_03120 [Corynebacterium tapiri]